MGIIVLSSMFAIFLKLDKRQIIKKPSYSFSNEVSVLNQNDGKMKQFLNSLRKEKSVVRSRWKLNEYVMVVAFVIAIWIFEIAPKSFSKQKQADKKSVYALRQVLFKQSQIKECDRVKHCAQRCV